MKTIYIKSVGVLSVVAFIVTLLFSTGCPIDGSSQPTPSAEELTYETVLDNLVIPWEIAFLPDGEMLFTERPGTLVRMGETKRTITIPGVESMGESGLMGLALHPRFDKNHWIYLSYTTRLTGVLENRVERYTYDLEKNVLTERKVIISGSPAARFHDGGRIAFSPDGKLYITTGDATNSDSAQDINSLAGKILRVNDDATIPADNPFGNAVYSYGHRNPQGLAWDDKGRLWATEHGRSGVLSGYDELNLVERGKNYGWPDLQGDLKRQGMEPPVVHSGPSYTWAPAGAVYFEGAILFTGLRGEALYRYDIKTEKLTEHLKGRFGRLRAIVVHEGWLYLGTSDRDGRGTVEPGDDRIIRIPLDYIRGLR
jgi:glucose/arabinose dehydrogenase